MAASIVLVHNDPEFVESIGKALQAAGYETVSYADTMSAINALDELQQIDMLISRVQFPAGQPNGVALGRMARAKRPGLRVLFVGQQERREHTDGVGEFLPAPVTAADVVSMVGTMLTKQG